MKSKSYFLILLLFVAAVVGCRDDSEEIVFDDLSIVAPSAEVKKLAGGFIFTEGPAADAQGNIFFSDIPNNKIHKWSLEGNLSTFLENSDGANGLYFDKDGNLLACQGSGRKLV